MAFMDAFNRVRDKNIIRQAYHGHNAANQSISEDEHHVEVLRQIGRTAAEEGWTIQEAYEAYDAYLGRLEGTDSAWDEEAAQEGEDPANYDEEDEL